MAQANPARVLVIDDDDIVRATMIEFLQDEGCFALGLPSPIGATRTILDENIDVVVIDIMMPTMRGDKLAEMLRRNDKFKKLGVVLISGVPEAEIQRLAVQVGANGVLHKDNMEELPRIVRSALAEARLSD